MSKVHSAEHEVLETKVVISGVGDLARKLILKSYNEGLNWSNEQIAMLVVQTLAKHGMEVKTGASSIAWYKNDMRKKNQLPQGRSTKSIEVDLESIAL